MDFLDDKLWFPDPDLADRDGLVAIGGDLSPGRLMLAYESGIFPWFTEGDPVLWWSPYKRMVLFPDELIISKSMRSIMKKQVFDITFNQAFKDVISQCSQVAREGQDGTWITDAMIDAYCLLHEQGHAKSVEVWQDEELIGGLYGVDLGKVFCGESMFSKVSNASKAAFIFLVQKLKAEGYELLDCQIYNDHLASLGAREIKRKEFLTLLRSASSSRPHGH